MSSLRINGISKNFFRTEPKKVERNQTNPFGVSFKGNNIVADVFVSQKKEAKDLSFKGRMKSSALVGSINDFSESMAKRLDSIMSMGRRIKARSIELWKRAQDIVIFDESRIQEVLRTDVTELRRSSTVNRLKQRPVSELRSQLESAIELQKA